MSVTEHFVAGGGGEASALLPGSCRIDAMKQSDQKLGLTA